MASDLSTLPTLALTAVAMWLGLLLLPWRPWSTRERIRADSTSDSSLLKEVSVLIPARNEASCIAQTLRGLQRQGSFAKVVLVDDQSDDGTKTVAQQFSDKNDFRELRIVDGDVPPAGWSGKLWALHQGLSHIETPYVLLIDADIELADDMAASLLHKLQTEKLDSVSVMATLYMGSWAEKLLLPPFIYFFKIIYPFRLANSATSRIAAAAGGCVMMKTGRLHDIGGFEALKSAIIDDCTLAKKIKSAGGRIWVGLSRDVRAIRPYDSLANIWNMVARTAYTQLRYSFLLLLICTVLMLVGYVVPLVALALGDVNTKLTALLALGLIWYSYFPTVKYYDLPIAWTITLPLAAALFLAMTWTSAYRYLRGERSRWKNRSYEREVEK